jgi:hypothetical protein
MLQLVENYVNKEYNDGNKRVFCYVDIDDEKVKGVDRTKFVKIIEEYLSANYNKMIAPLLKQKDLGKGVKTHTPQQAVKIQTDRIINYYLD